jgi:hypothetical protein
MFGDSVRPVIETGQGTDPEYLKRGADQCTARVYDECKSEEPRRSNLRERIRIAIHEGERASRRLNAALRAKYIIDQHPELAELLDALAEF